VRRVLDGPHFVLVVLVLAMGLRIAWICVADPSPVSDTLWYYRAAVSISEGHGYAMNGVPTAYYAAGEPLFAGAIFKLSGPNLAALRIANLFLALGGLLLAYRVARRLFTEPIARITLLILALSPNQISHTSLVASELLFTFLMLLAVRLLLDERWWIIALGGVAVGSSAYVRPVGLLIPLAFLLSQRRWRPVLLASGVAVLTLAPWVWRNNVTFNGAVLLSTNLGYNLIVGNNPAAAPNGAFLVAPETFQMMREPYRTAIQDLNQFIWNPDRPLPISEDELDREARAAAWQYIRENPGSVVALIPRRFWAMYERDQDGIYWNEVGGAGRPADWTGKASQVYYRLLQCLFVLSMLLIFCRPIKGWRVVLAVGLSVMLFFLTMSEAAGWKAKVLAAVLTFGTTSVFLGPGLRVPPYKSSSLPLWFIGLFTLFYLPFYGASRYHFPMIPWIAMYAATGVAMMLRWEQPAVAAAGAAARQANR